MCGDGAIEQLHVLQVRASGGSPLRTQGSESSEGEYVAEQRKAMRVSMVATAAGVVPSDSAAAHADGLVGDLVDADGDTDDSGGVRIIARLV